MYHGLQKLPRVLHLGPINIKIFGTPSKMSTIITILKISNTDLVLEEIDFSF